MTSRTLARAVAGPALAPAGAEISAGVVPSAVPLVEAVPLTVSYAEHDALVRGALATLAAFAGGFPNPLGYLRDALGDTQPRPGAHPREYAPVESEDAVWGRW
jgi:hypothetical protein